MTTEEFWKHVHGDRAVWRTARRKESFCANQRIAGECLTKEHMDLGPAIAIGDRYFDSGETTIHQWATAKFCVACAARTETSATKELEGHTYTYDALKGILP